MTAIMGAAFIALAAGGTGAIVKYMRKEAGFANVNAASISIESSILLALQNPELYTKETTAFMRAGGENVVKNVKIMGEKGPVAEVGGTVTLDASGAACVPTPTAPCAMTTHVRIDCASGGCKAAYQIEFSPPPGNREVASNTDKSQVRATLPPLGSAHWPPVVGSNDFAIVLGYDLFRREDGKNICGPGELFVSGLDKNSGNVSCVLPSQRALASNQIGESMVYDTTTHSLEFVPRTLQKLHCPAKYVLRTMDPSSLDQGRNAQGTCVYRYKKEVNWMEQWPSGQASVSGPFCPQEDYGVVPNGNCTMNVISQTNGLCPRTCCDDKGNCSDCSYTVPPNISYRLDQNYDARGPNVSCSLVKTGSQQCGASWEGEVQWSGKCKIYVPEHQPASGSTVPSAATVTDPGTTTLTTDSTPPDNRTPPSETPEQAPAETGVWVQAGSGGGNGDCTSKPGWITQGRSAPCTIGDSCTLRMSGITETALRQECRPKRG
ncbi:MAG: hypothetical protein EOP11_16380 [Proteobacteria bacterium]|nr:MAG: hypothetical protein EOP11_16380 [Pseudomonadota bacterium]